MPDRLEIPAELWKTLLSDLKKYGQNIRETGAFLFGPIDQNIISEYKLYIEFDPEAFHSGWITFEQNGYRILWEYCLEKKLRVLADVHTHPSDWVGQSQIDKEHPMIAQKGHIALIVPNFSMDNEPPLKTIGIYKYLGNYKWETDSSLIQII